MRPIAYIFIISFLIACGKSGSDSSNYTEKYRPQFHFSPEKNWTNDPNGLVFYKDEYHLFYQYNPYGTTWGHMSWGHAVSKDLLHWEHLPIAIPEYLDPITGDSTMVFSGTCVVDKNNTSGLCTGGDCLVAIFTSHVHKDNQGIVQHQSLAYSNDAGRTWNRYDKNPILDIKRKDFRDPKVFWYEPEQKWVMALVIPDQFKVQLYESKNLKAWSLMSEFGGIGDTTRIWECPDLYNIKFESDLDSGSKWVLSLSGSHPSGPDFVGMQYFVGEFDGKKFTIDNTLIYPMYLDHGKDFYAGIVVNNLPPADPGPIMIGWANNWTYGNKIPTSPWRSAMAIPRELSLKEIDNRWRIIQKPLQALTSLRGKEITDLSHIADNVFEAEIEIDRGNSTGCGIEIYSGKDEKIIIGYHSESNEFYVDRTHSGNINFDKSFASVEKTYIAPFSGPLKLHVFVDHSIVEVFVNDGELTFSEQIFPTQNEFQLKTYFEEVEGSATVKAWELKSVWR